MITEDELRDILDGKIGEGQKLDLKAHVNLDDKDKKSDLVDDAVAFLNASGGTILIGLREDRKTNTVSLSPVEGDTDGFCLQIQQILKSNISPPPRDLNVDSIPVEGGSVLAVSIGESYNKPYCNKVSGRYLQRHGRKNEPLMPGEVKALFENRTKLIEGVGRLSKERLDALKDGNFFAPDFPWMCLSILPFRHLDETASPFRPSNDEYSRKGMKAPHGSFKPFLRVFNGCEVSATDGYGEKIGSFFVGDDWFIQSVMCHPIPYDPNEGRLNLTKFKQELSTHFEDVLRFMTAEALGGPFAIEGAIYNLHAKEHFTFIFPRSSSISFGRASFVEAFDPHELVELIYQRVFQSSIHAGY